MFYKLKHRKVLKSKVNTFTFSMEQRRIRFSLIGKYKISSVFLPTGDYHFETAIISQEGIRVVARSITHREILNWHNYFKKLIKTGKYDHG